MEDRSAITIRQMTLKDLSSVVALLQRAYPDMPVWKMEELTHHLAVFPEGQLVAVDQTDRIVGSSSSLIIDWDDYTESAHWATITGSGTFNTHNPLGKTLYGADMGVDPTMRCHGIGSLQNNMSQKSFKVGGKIRL
jgi:hypothetical protein